MKALIIYMQLITLVAATYIILVQQKYISYSDDNQQKLFIDISIPVALVLMCCSIQVGYTAIF